MKIFRTFWGATLLVASIMGDTTSKAGRYISVASEWGAYGSKHVANGLSILAQGTGDLLNKFDPAKTNDFIQVNANLTYATSHLIQATGNIFEATERTAKNGQTLFAKAEAKSQALNAYAYDLLDSRKNEYRDLELDFDWRGSNKANQILDSENLVLVNQFPTKKQLTEINRTERQLEAKIEVRPSFPYKR